MQIGSISMGKRLTMVFWYHQLSPSTIDYRTPLLGNYISWVSWELDKGGLLYVTSELNVQLNSAYQRTAALSKVNGSSYSVCYIKM